MEATVKRPLYYDADAGQTYGGGDYQARATALVQEARSGMKVDEVRDLIWRAMRHGFSHGAEVALERNEAENPYLTPAEVEPIPEPEWSRA